MKFSPSRIVTALLLSSAFLALSSFFGVIKSGAAQSAADQPPGGAQQSEGGAELTAETLRALPLAITKRDQAQIEAERVAAVNRRAQQSPPKPAPELDLAASFDPRHELAVANAPSFEAPAPLTQFRALTATGDFAADTGIAVSRTHIVQTTRTTIGFFDKTGKQLQQLSAATFFAPLNLDHRFPGFAPVNAYFDTRCLYDEYRNRFWVAALAINKPATADGQLTKYAVAVSKTENPLDGWYLYFWDAVAGDGSDFLGAAKFNNKKGDAGDYPCLGIDQFGFYVTNAVNNNGSRRYWNVIFYPAQPLANGVAANGWTFADSLRDPNNQVEGAVIQPAVHHGATTTTYFASYFKKDKISVWKLTNHLQAGMQMKSTAVAIAPLNAVSNGRQKGNAQYPNPEDIRFTNVGNEVLKTVFRNNRLFVAMQDGSLLANVPVRTDLRIIRIPNVSNAALTPDVDQKAADENLVTQNGFPALEVNGAGDAVIVYGYTSLNDFPGCKYRTLPANQSSLSTARILKAGEDTFVIKNLNASLPLYDLNNAAVDPYDDTAIWIAAPYSIKLSERDSDNFAVYVGKIFGEKKPDLLIDRPVATNKLLLRPGDAVQASAHVRNQGDAATSVATPVNLYLSTDPIISILDTKLGEATLNVLSANAETTLNYNVTLPANTAPGLYYIGALIFPANQEYTLTNNNGRTAQPLKVRTEDALGFLPKPGAKWHESFSFGDEIPLSGDFNGDGRDDIVTFNRNDGFVYVATSDGAKFNGNGAAARWAADFCTGLEVPLVGDFDGDGKDDIVALVQDAKTGVNQGEIYVALSEGNKFGVRVKWNDSYSLSKNNLPAVGDVNGDGLDDLVVVNTPSQGHAYVALSDGARFGDEKVWLSNFVAVNGPEKIAVRDFNGDGKADLVSFNPTNGDVFVVLANGASFGAKQKWHESFVNGAELGLAGDFNGDGKDDVIAFTRGASGDVFVAASDAAKFANPRVKWHDAFCINQETPVIGDFNGDGADDIATFLRGGSGDVFVSLARPPKALANLSAASYLGNALAADSIIAVFGQGLATSTQKAPGLPLPIDLGGTTVQVRDKNGVTRPASLFFVSAGQANYLMPTGTELGAAEVMIGDGAGSFSAGKVQIAKIAPGLFSVDSTGKGFPAAVVLRVKGDGSQSFEPVALFDNTMQKFVAAPIDLGPATDKVFLLLFGTGLRGRSSLAAVTLAVSGVSAPVSFAGAQGALVGLDQVNAQLPRTLIGKGEVEVTLIVDGQIANTLKINVK